MDLEIPEFFNEEVVQARKEHKCYECRRTIEKGWYYHRSTGKWDGQVSTYKTCNRCTMIQKWMREFADNNDLEFSLAFGSLYDEIRLHEFHVPHVLREGCPYPETVVRFCWDLSQQMNYHHLLKDHPDYNSCSCELAAIINKRLMTGRETWGKIATGEL
jgi:hypothetical protein